MATCKTLVSLMSLVVEDSYQPASWGHDENSCQSGGPLLPHSNHRVFSNLQTIFCFQHRPLLFSAEHLTPSVAVASSISRAFMVQIPSSEFSRLFRF